MVKVREASFDDFKSIDALESQYGLESKKTEARDHLWKDNPAILETKESRPIGWVLENDNKKVVGYFGNIPMAYELGGRRILASAATSFVVDLAYRNYSILLAKSFFGQRYADLLLMTTSNHEAGRVYSTFKAKKAPVEDYDTVFFWIINYRNFIFSSLAKKEAPFRYAIAPSLSVIVKGIDLLLRRSRGMKENGAAVCDQDLFDNAFDIFWERLRRRYPARLLYVRNSQNLNWHFKFPIADKKLWIYSIKGSGGEIKAYAIFLRQDNPKVGLKRARIIDFQSIDDDPDLFTSILSAGIKRCQEEGIDLLEVIGFNSGKRSIMAKYAQHKRRLPSWPFYYKTGSSLLVEKLSDPMVWDPCLLDGDASF